MINSIIPQLLCSICCSNLALVQILIEGHENIARFAKKSRSLCRYPYEVGQMVKTASRRALSLQSLSRRAFLQTLPFGMLARRQIVEKLDYPVILKKYLNFDELEAELAIVSAVEANTEHSGFELVSDKDF